MLVIHILYTIFATSINKLFTLINLNSIIMKTQNEIKTFLETIEIDNLYLFDCINIDDIDQSDPFNSLFEMIEENGGFNVDIIYYSNAIQYLKDHDASLNESIEIAIEYGYTIDKLNSELLASLLASKNVMDEFIEYRNEIETFFN